MDKQHLCLESVKPRSSMGHLTVDSHNFSTGVVVDRNTAQVFDVPMECVFHFSGDVVSLGHCECAVHTDRNLNQQVKTDAMDVNLFHLFDALHLGDDSSGPFGDRFLREDVHEIGGRLLDDLDAGVEDPEGHNGGGEGIDPEVSGPAEHDADDDGGNGQDIVAVVSCESGNGNTARLTSDPGGEPGEPDFGEEAREGDPECKRSGPGEFTLADEEIVDLADGVPEDRHGRGDNEGANDDGGNAFELAMAEGMLSIGLFSGEAHENANDYQVNHVRRGVDPVSQQSRAVAKDAHGRLDGGQGEVGSQAQIDCQEVMPVVGFVRGQIEMPIRSRDSSEAVFRPLGENQACRPKSL